MLFRPLTLPEIERIVDLLTEDLRRSLADGSVSLELSEAARELMPGGLPAVQTGSDCG